MSNEMAGASISALQLDDEAWHLLFAAAAKYTIFQYILTLEGLLQWSNLTASNLTVCSLNVFSVVLQSKKMHLIALE